MIDVCSKVHLRCLSENSQFDSDPPQFFTYLSAKIRCKITFGNLHKCIFLRSIQWYPPPVGRVTLPGVKISLHPMAVHKVVQKRQPTPV